MDESDDQAIVSRRTALSLLGVGGLGLATGQVTGQDHAGPPHYNWREDVDANGHALEDLGALSMAENPTPIRDFAGESLKIEGGTLHVDGDIDSPTDEMGIVHVDEFGAEGDGETNDSQAIQDAVNSIEEKAALVFSSGKRYLLEDTVTINVNRVRVIYGNNAYLIIDDNIVGLDIHGEKDEPGSGPDWPIQHELKDEEFSSIIHGLQIYSPSYTGVGIRLRNQFATTVSNCHFFNLDYALRIGDFTRNLILSDNNIWDNQTAGIHMTGDNSSRSRADIHQIVVADSNISYNRNSILIDDNFQVYNLHIGNCIMEAQTDQQDGFESFINAQGPTQEVHVATTNFQDHNAGDDALIKFEGSVGSRFSITSSYINLTNGDGLRMKDPEEVTIVGNIFDRLEGDAVTLTDGTEIAINSNVFQEVSGNAVEIDGTDRFAVNGNAINAVDSAAIALSGNTQIGTVSSNQAYNVKTFLDANTSDSILGTIVESNNIRPRDSPAININSGGNIRNVSVSSNGLYWYNSEMDLDGYAIDISCSDLTGYTMRDNRLFARGGEFDGMRVNSTGDTMGVRIKGNIIDELAANTEVFDFPEPVTNSVIVDENLNVR